MNKSELIKKLEDIEWEDFEVKEAKSMDYLFWYLCRIIENNRDRHPFSYTIDILLLN